MSSKEEDLKSYFQRLESLHPHRDLTILSLELLVRDAEIDFYRSYESLGPVDDFHDWATPAIADALLRTLSHDPDPKIRGKAADSLGEIAHMILAHHVKPLLDTAQFIEQGLISALGDKDPKVQKAVTSALRKKGTPSALAVLPPKPWWKIW